MAEPTGTASCSEQEGTGNGFINGRIIIQKHRSMLQRELNVSVLLPYLNKYHMITTDLHDELTLPITTNAAKVNRLMSELPKMRGDYLECLIKCLQESAKEDLATSHDEIANVLQKELEHQNTSGLVCSITTETAGSANSLVCGRVLQKFHTELRRDLNIPVLLPYLIKYHLITASFQQELELQNITPNNKVDRLMAELPRKGENSLELFIKCLRESVTEVAGTNHKSIADILDKELKLRNSPGFIDSYEDHTESVQMDKEVKYIGEQLHEPLIVEGEPHRHPNPIGKKLKKICCNRWCLCYTGNILVIALLSSLLPILSQLPHLVLPSLRPKVIFDNSTVQLQFSQMSLLDRLDLRLSTESTCSPKLYVMQGQDCSQLPNVTTHYVDPCNPLDHVYMRPGSTINFTVSPNSNGHVWIFSDQQSTDDFDRDASAFDCQQQSPGTFCFEAADIKNGSYLHQITQPAYYSVRQRPETLYCNVTPNQTNFSHSYYRVLFNISSSVANVIHLSPTLTPIHIGKPFIYEKTCILLYVSEWSDCDRTRLQFFNATRRQDFLLYPGIAVIFLVVTLIIVITVHIWCHFRRRVRT